jgi:general secretion pathway protein D
VADEQRDVTKAGVPFLSSLPLVGGFFGSHVKQATETALFVFLTPRVIRTDDELDQASDSVGREREGCESGLNVRGGLGR